MSDYINGRSYPVVIIKDAETDEIIETIQLDLCMSAGEAEGYEEDFKRNKLETGRLVDYDFKGSNITFTLDYSEYVRKSNLFKIEKIFAYHSQPETYKIILRPRADVQKREFEVRFATGNYQLGVLPGGAYSPGNRLAVIEFVTVQPTSKMFVDPDNLSVPCRYKSQ